MRRRVRLRFNLGKGKNHLKWRVLWPDGRAEYLDPSEVQLVASGCTLKNSKRAAQRIFEGANKTVCAWVLCDELRVERALAFSASSEVQAEYNPRVAPNWRIGETDADGRWLPLLHTIGKGVYLTPAL